MTLIGKCKLYFDTVIDLFQIKDQVVPPSKWKDLKTLKTTLPQKSYKIATLAYPTADGA